ncbi:hypothetical protein OROMI_008322 [Orobanche minor]
MEKNESVATDKEPNYRGIKAMPFVIGNETFEKLGTIGTSSNLLVYLTTVYNMKSITATNVINIFNGTCNFGTLLGGFLSDTYLGRYRTLGIASISSFMGMLVLTMTAAFPNLHPPTCRAQDNNATPCMGPSPWQLTFLYAAFAFLIVGASGIRPCNLAFGADQFNPNSESGKRGINSFFNWYYFTFTFAMMLSLTIIVYVQSSVDWAIGLGIPTFLMFLSCTFFFVGTKIYVRILPQGSPLTSVVQTLVVAFKKRRLELPEQPWSSLFNHIPCDSINSKLAYTDQLRFLNKAAILTPEDEINSDGSAANPWNLRSSQQVEEIKCVLRCSKPFKPTHNFKIPAASYTVFTMITLTVWIPIYDRVLVPLLRRVTGKEEGITILQRVGIGLVFAVLTMFVSGAVENYRRTLASTRPTLGFVARKGAISSMSGNWLIPQLALTGMSEAFCMIGQVEFYYKQFPENMRSFGGSFLFCGFASASYFSSFLISVVHNGTRRVGEDSSWLAEDLNKGRLDYFYYLIGGLEVLNLGYFLVCAKWYRYKKNEFVDVGVALEKSDSKKFGYP